MRRFRTNVIMTNEFPTIANKRIVAYNGICKRPLDSQSNHDAADVVVVIDCTLWMAIVVTVVVDTSKLSCVTYFA